MDTGEHPDKTAEITEAKRLRQSRQDYRAVTDKMLGEMRRCEVAVDAIEDASVGAGCDLTLYIFNHQDMIARLKKEHGLMKAQIRARRGLHNER